MMGVVYFLLNTVILPCTLLAVSLCYYTRVASVCGAHATCCCRCFGCAAPAYGRNLCCTPCTSCTPGTPGTPGPISVRVPRCGRCVRPRLAIVCAGALRSSHAANVAWGCCGNRVAPAHLRCSQHSSTTSALRGKTHQHPNQEPLHFPNPCTGALAGLGLRLISLWMHAGDDGSDEIGPSVSSCPSGQYMGTMNFRKTVYKTCKPACVKPLKEPTSECKVFLEDADVRDENDEKIEDQNFLAIVISGILAAISLGVSWRVYIYIENLKEIEKKETARKREEAKREAMKTQAEREKKQRRQYVHHIPLSRCFSFAPLVYQTPLPLSPRVWVYACVCSVLVFTCPLLLTLPKIQAHDDVPLAPFLNPTRCARHVCRNRDETNMLAAKQELEYWEGKVKRESDAFDLKKAKIGAEVRKELDRIYGLMNEIRANGRQIESERLRYTVTFNEEKVSHCSTLLHYMYLLPLMLFCCPRPLPCDMQHVVPAALLFYLCVPPSCLGTLPLRDAQAAPHHRLHSFVRALPKAHANVSLWVPLCVRPSVSAQTGPTHDISARLEAVYRLQNSAWLVKRKSRNTIGKGKRGPSGKSERCC